MIFSVFDRVENIVGKGENAGFSFSHNVFKRLLSPTRQNVSLCGNGLNRQKHQFILNCYLVIADSVILNSKTRCKESK